MNLEVTRNVILDLLPLYLAGEVSADTTALVENYLKADPELAQLAQQTAATDLSEIPIPLTKEDAMIAYVKATQRMLMRTLGLGALFVVIFVVLAALVMALIYGGFR